MIKYFIFLILFPLFVLQFQNCGNGANILKDHEAESRAQFFDYPYLQKPEFYHEIFLSKETTSASLTDRYKILANVARTNGDQSQMAFKMDIQDQEGAIICPSYIGNLSANATTIEYECVGVQDQVSVVVLLTLTVGTDRYEIKKVLEP